MPVWLKEIMFSGLLSGKKNQLILICWGSFCILLHIILQINVFATKYLKFHCCYTFVILIKATSFFFKNKPNFLCHFYNFEATLYISYR